MKHLTEQNYYSDSANTEYMSVSQFKDFQKCEAMAMAKINGEWSQPKSKALLLGSYVDEMLTGTVESINTFLDENHSEVFKKNSERNLALSLSLRGVLSNSTLILFLVSF